MATKYKTKKQKEIDAGLKINLVEVEAKITKNLSRKIEMIYKQTHFDHNKDQFFVKRVRRQLELKTADKMTIIKVKIIKEIGTGIHES